MWSITHAPKGIVVSLPETYENISYCVEILKEEEYENK